MTGIKRPSPDLSANLHLDGAEMNDVSAKYPEKVKNLDQMWQNWALRNKVFPKPGK